MITPSGAGEDSWESLVLQGNHCFYSVPQILGCCVFIFISFSMHILISPVNPKGNQPWIFTGRTDTEDPIFWPSDAKCGLIGKDPLLGKI